MTKTFQGRPIVKGTIRAEAVVSHGGFNPLASINTAGTPINRKGLCTDQNNPDLYNKVVTGKALCLPEIIGSTTGGMVLYSVCKKGFGPACMLYSKRADTLGVSGAVLLANWSSEPLVMIDELGDGFLDYVRDGMVVTTKPDGTVVLEG